MEGGEIRAAFDRLDEAVIDACSIIYLLKTGVFESLGAILKLDTTGDVYRETGWPLKDGRPRLPLTLFPSSEMARSNDHGLFLLAKSRSLPLISEDKEVLEMAAGEGLPYYNSLMMLLFLLYKGRITQGDYEEYKIRLLGEARYGESIIKRGEEYYRDLFL